MSPRENQGPGEINIRPVLPTDAAAIYAIAADPEVARFTDKFPGLEYVEIEEWLAKPEDGQYRFAAEISGSAVGLALLECRTRSRINHIGDLSLMIQPDHWGKGIGTNLAVMALDLADDWLNLKRLKAKVLVGNEAAISLFEKLGFEAEGIHRQSLVVDGIFQDEVHLSRLRGIDVINHEETPTTNIDHNLRTGSPSTKGPNIGEEVQVEIRPLDPNDSDDLYEIFRHRQVCRTTLQMPSQESSANLKRMHDLAPGLHRFAAVAQEQVVGTITLRQHHVPRRAHVGRIGMAVHPNFWGYGIGSRLMEAVLDLADNWLDLKRIELDVNTDNPAGIRLYKKYDFAVEGVKRLHTYGDGRWVDSFFMARIR